MRLIDRLVDLLPVPILVGSAGTAATAWLVKSLNDFASYGPVLASNSFYASVAIIWAGVVIYYVVTRPKPFKRFERGILVAAFEGDTNSNVQRHTFESLQAHARERSDLASVRAMRLGGQVSDGSAPKTLRRRRADSIISGSVISPTLVWYTIYWRERPTMQMSVNGFPNIDPFKERFFQALGRPHFEALETSAAEEPRRAFWNARKIALVIANAHYQDLAPLPGVVVDAKAMVATFEQLAIEVDLVLDGTRTAILDKLRRTFGARGTQARADVFVYYSGHGTSEGPAGILGIDSLEPILLQEIVAMADSAEIDSTFLFLDTIIGSLADITSPRVSILTAGQTGEMIEDAVGGGVFTNELARQLLMFAERSDAVLYFDDLAQVITRAVVEQTQNRNRPLALSLSRRVVAASPN